ncbi:protein PHR1-LIKE 3-like [Primulina eburnea]|uniref:protein PHR1-LIKE 3-like n=1 Tax=Primulina eburnea TaxID=1245227 RepID=UPI003C6CB60D
MGMERTALGGSRWSGGVGGGVESVFEGVDRHVNRGLPVIIGGFDQVQPLQPVDHAGTVDSCEEKQNKCFNGCSRTCFSTHRLRWTPELHKQFVDAVNLLGGANEATPRAILNMMEVEGLTLYHIKSHLQKYRNGKTEVRLWRKPFIPLPPSYFSVSYNVVIISLI